MIPKAWIVFDGTGPTIFASANVASIIRNSPGNYSVYFTNSIGASAGMAGNSQGLVRPISVSSFSANFDTAILSGGLFQPHDYNYVSCLFFSL